MPEDEALMDLLKNCTNQTTITREYWSHTSNILVSPVETVVAANDKDNDGGLAVTLMLVLQAGSNEFHIHFSDDDYLEKDEMIDKDTDDPNPDVEQQDDVGGADKRRDSDVMMFDQAELEKASENPYFKDLLKNCSTKVLQESWIQKEYLENGEASLFHLFYARGLKPKKNKHSGIVGEWKTFSVPCYDKFMEEAAKSLSQSSVNEDNEG
jgi:hypothetical protein